MCLTVVIKHVFILYSLFHMVFALLYNCNRQLKQVLCTLRVKSFKRGGYLRVKSSWRGEVGLSIHHLILAHTCILAYKYATIFSIDPNECYSWKTTENTNLIPYSKHMGWTRTSWVRIQTPVGIFIWKVNYQLVTGNPLLTDTLVSGKKALLTDRFFNSHFTSQSNSVFTHSHKHTLS